MVLVKYLAVRAEKNGSTKGCHHVRTGMEIKLERAWMSTRLRSIKWLVIVTIEYSAGLSFSRFVASEGSLVGYKSPANWNWCNKEIQHINTGDGRPWRVRWILLNRSQLYICAVIDIINWCAPYNHACSDRSEACRLTAILAHHAHISTTPFTGGHFTGSQHAM